MSRFRLLPVIFILFFSSLAAQTRLITGQVASSDSGSLVGVSINIKGTRIGTSTNERGEFSINATLGSTLVFSSVGYDTKEVVAKSNNISAQLTPSNNKLSERREEVSTGTYSGRRL